MLSKNKIKYIRSLELKKKRKEEQVFVAEGQGGLFSANWKWQSVTCRGSSLINRLPIYVLRPQKLVLL